MRRVLGGGILLLFCFFSADDKDRSLREHQKSEGLLIAGSALLENGEYVKALSNLLKARQSYATENDSSGTLKSLSKLGIVYWNIGNLPECKNVFENAMRVAVGLKDAEIEKEYFRKSLNIIHLYENGRSLRSGNKLSEAIDNFIDAINQARRINSRALEQKCLRQLGATYLEKNDLENYFIYNKRSLNLSKELRCRREEAMCLNNLGIYYFYKCNYSKALRLYDAAIKINHEIGEFENLNSCLTNKNLVYIKLGEYGKAKEIQEEIIRNEILDNNKEESLAFDLNNLGIIKKKLGCLIGNMDMVSQAILHYKESERIAKKMNSSYLIACTQLNLGEAYGVLGHNSEALRYYDLSHSLASRIRSYEVLINNNIGKARILRELNNNDEAIRLLRDAIQFASQNNLIKDLWEVYKELGMSYEKAGSYESAREQYERSIECIDIIGNQNYGDSIKIGIYRNKRNVFEKIIRLYQEGILHRSPETRAEESFKYAEKAKAQVFLENLIDRPRQEIKIFERKKYKFPGKYLDDVIVPFMNFDYIQPLKNSMYIDIGEVSQRRIDPKGEFERVLVSGSEIIRKDILDTDTILFEYVLSEPNSYLFILDNDSCRVFHLPSRAALEKSIKGYIKLLSHAVRRSRLGDEASRRIYSEILFPLEESRYWRKSKLIIIPDGLLNYLPFEALKQKDTKGNEAYLIERYQVSYAPSANILRYLIKRSSDNKFGDGLFAFGDPTTKEISTNQKEKNSGILYEELYGRLKDRLPNLPFSRDEINYAAGKFPSRKVMKYFGSDAEEVRIKNLNGRHFDVIHFSCHGLIDEICPMQSCLALMGNSSKEEDGFLQAREICEMSLEANLVILSACQTARGAIVEGEGIMGLPRAFFYAGASSVLSTLWPINDSAAAVFIQYFYDFLQRGLSKSQALQRTKIKMIGKGYLNPRDWAPYILYGDPTSRIEFGNQSDN